MSLNSTLGAGMASVAGTAMLAHSIAQQANALAEARDSLEAMTRYAAKLEGSVRQLHQLVIADNNLIEALKASVEEAQSERDEMAQKNRELQARIELLVANGHKDGVLFNRQVEYMQDLKDRLQQTEKALKHSSSRSVGLENLQAYLVQVTAALENHSGITEEAKAIVEHAYDQFMESSQLTPDPVMQKILDELKIKAPDFKPGLYN